MVSFAATFYYRTEIIPGLLLVSCQDSAQMSSWGKTSFASIEKWWSNWVERKKAYSLEKVLRVVLRLPKVKWDRLFRNLKPKSRPIVNKSRKCNKEDRLLIEAEVRKLLLEGIIEPSFSPWRAQALIVCDERHKPRMVVNYSLTVCRFILLDAYPLLNIDEQIARASVFRTLDFKSTHHQLSLHAEDQPFYGF